MTSASSGSIPVVSQSIIRPIVPVGARTDACALRYPNCSPSETASSHDCFAADSIPSGTNSASISSAAARCLRMTRSIASRFGSNPSNGPIASAIRALVRYACPVISAVMAPAHARPPSESYGRPRAISSAPRFA